MVGRNGDHFRLDTFLHVVRILQVPLISTSCCHVFIERFRFLVMVVTC